MGECDGARVADNDAAWYSAKVEDLVREYSEVGFPLSDNDIGPSLSVGTSESFKDLKVDGLWMLEIMHCVGVPPSIYLKGGGRLGNEGKKRLRNIARAKTYSPDEATKKAFRYLAKADNPDELRGRLTPDMLATVALYESESLKRAKNRRTKGQ